MQTFNADIVELENSIPENIMTSTSVMKKFKKLKKFSKKCEKSIDDMSSLKTNILTGSKLLEFYVQDLLDLAQIRSGKIVKNIERTDINDLLREIIQT